ncbi:hypothetical protein SAMN04488055_2251 [Chitinophaga niabensis]|uniref:Uncharacterized protein n=1 Tax=Chitinophaga niabensis TaxID=536979 RepID=A0A1N6FJC7_9BACT|nr:hypothetical protein SAMN04488055_2251 [Chitinophaga niabensis]
MVGHNRQALSCLIVSKDIKYFAEMHKYLYKGKIT